MSNKANIGKNTLGDGSKNQVNLPTYSRANFNTGNVFRTTASPGTLVPFMYELLLTGDTMDIDLDFDIKTHPTVGPLFGSFKAQLDVFRVPLKPYSRAMLLNKQRVGLDISKILLPQIRMKADNVVMGADIDNQQINPSSIFKYMGISGLGHSESNASATVTRDFTALKWLMTADLYKQYYANTQEEEGCVIHNNLLVNDITISAVKLMWWSITSTSIPQTTELVVEGGTGTAEYGKLRSDSKLEIRFTLNTPDTTINTEQMYISVHIAGIPDRYLKITEVFVNCEYNAGTGTVFCDTPRTDVIGTSVFEAEFYRIDQSIQDRNDVVPNVVRFPLQNIDDIKEEILGKSDTTPYLIDENTRAPYGLALYKAVIPSGTAYSKQYSQEGLFVKTYQSDLYNNWVQNNRVGGANGIDEISAIDTSSGSFNISTLVMAEKVYNILNAVAVKGGTMLDYFGAAYDETIFDLDTMSTYIGGASQILAFDEVYSQSATTDQPLGTLAGKGGLVGKSKGGKIVIRNSGKLPAYVIGVFSLTPLIDYSQGNKWDNNLKDLADLHIPEMDGIGWQDLITDQMHWAETAINSTASNEVLYRSAGKVPAWINYQTNVNELYGNFARQDSEQFMVLARRYGIKQSASPTGRIYTIKDLTTYVDPSLYNYIFAYTKIDAMNFWVQIRKRIMKRSKMSARQIPRA